MPSLPALVAQARDVGFSSWQPAPALVVHVIDYRHFADAGDEVRVLRETAEADVGWPLPNDGKLVYRATARHTRMRDRGESLATIAPVTIFPLPVRDVVEILLGFVDVSVYVNMEVLKELFLQHGILISVDPSTASHTFFTALDGNGGVQIPASVREQMLHELMTPSTLLALVDHILCGGLHVELARSPAVVGFNREREVWSPHSRLKVA